MTQSTLDKLVTKKVADVQNETTKKKAEEARKEAEFKAKLPQTREERAKIIYPSITDGDDWSYYFAAGFWRLKFKVGKYTFEIHDEFIPYDEGTPSEGYGPTPAHWAPYLYDPNGRVLGSVGDVDDSWLAHRNDEGESAKFYKKRLAELVKEVNDGIAQLIEQYLLNNR